MSNPVIRSVHRGAPVSSLFIADTLDVSRQEFRFEETVDGHIRHRFFGTDGKSFEKADNDFVKNKTRGDR